MITCENCGGEIADTAKFCLKCGRKVERHPCCPNCGMELKPNTKFCPACGTALVRQTQIQGVQSASKNQGLFSYGQNFSSNTNTLPKKERSFNLWQKFFTLLVVFGYFMSTSTGGGYFMQLLTLHQFSAITAGGVKLYSSQVVFYSLYP